jgi:inner membrane protein
VQWFAFSIVSLGGLATLRGPLLRRLGQRPAPSTEIASELVGEQAVLLGDLEAGGEAKAELRGTPWTVKAASGIALRRGQRCRVERVDGLTLWVRAE